MRTLFLTALTIVGLSSNVYAKPNIKMVCNLEVSDSGESTEFLTQQIFLTSESAVEISGQAGEVPSGYEQYGAVIANSSRGFVVVLLDGGKTIGSQLIPYSNTEFKVKRGIDNLKFDQLVLDCGTAL